MKLEETENLKLENVKKYSNNYYTNKSYTQFRFRFIRKKSLKFAKDTDIALLTADKKKQDNKNKPQKYKKPNKSFCQYMQKDQNLPNKNIHSNNSSGKPFPNTSS